MTSNSKTSNIPKRFVRMAIWACVASCLCGVFAAPALAQGSRTKPERIEPGKVQITGLYGYQFGGSLDVDGAKIEIDSATAYGAQIGLRVQDDGFAYVSYSRQSTTARVRPTDATLDSSIPLDIGYIQVGGELDLPMRTHFVPFIGLGIGATHFTPTNSNAGTDWFFSGTALAGVKIPIAEHIGLRTQMRFLGTLMSSDSSWYCGSFDGSGSCAVNLNDTNGTIQGDITAGLYISF